MNGFLHRPPMGWNSYDYYDTNVTEVDILSNAQYMARHLKPYGWEYVVVDIQWYAYHTASMRDQFQYIPFGRVEMDEFGRLLPCPEKFPSSVGGQGFKPLADQIHALGLKFGIHIMRGIPRMAAHLHLPILGSGETADMVADPSSVCPWNPDMYGLRSTEAGQAYYDSLFRLYAQWGVDFVKCDDICSADYGPSRKYLHKAEVEMLSKAIERSGRDMVLSLSPGPAQVEESWHYRRYANMWRITDDFWDSWDALLHMFERCEKWQDHVSPGCYPDCDMLPLGRIGKHFGQDRQTNFTPEEQRTMMSLWCIFGSPLMLGAEMTLLDSDTLSLLQNEALLRLENGRFRSRQVIRNEKMCIWTATDPTSGQWYFALFNLSEKEATLSAPAEACQAIFPEFPLPRTGTVLSEVWTGQQTVLTAPALTAAVPAHGVRLYHTI